MANDDSPTPQTSTHSSMETSPWAILKIFFLSLRSGLHNEAACGSNDAGVGLAGTPPTICALLKREDSKRMTWLFWSLLSAAFAAATAVLAKVGVTGVDSNLATAIRTLVVLVFTWAIVFATDRPAVTHLTGHTWLFLTLSGLATGLSWLCYFRALQLGPASRVAPVDKLSVVFVILLAAAFLGERLTVGKAAGGLLIAAGAIILALD